jgi:hypothetical protein
VSGIEDAVAWLTQAQSDARTAKTVAGGGSPMLPGDVGCHVALLCAQSFEKCIKGSMLLVGQTPKLTHEVEAGIDSMLTQADIRKKAPWNGLRPLFRSRGARRVAKKLLAWTPGAASAANPNYEYPWRRQPATVLEVPYEHSLFEDEAEHEQWIDVVRTLSDGLGKIAEAVLRGG